MCYGTGTAPVTRVPSNRGDGHGWQPYQTNASAKCVRVDSRADKGNHDTRQTSKKARLEVEASAVDPYKTLPPPTTSFVQLRFQLARFKGVYRVPLNYTFANLYTPILFMFGRSVNHAHRENVYSHVETCSRNYKAGHIQKYGKPAPLPDTDDEVMLGFYELTRRTDIAEHELVRKGRSTKARGRWDFDDFDDTEVRVEDQDLCLSLVWNEKLRRNGNKGACTKREMGVIYEYDLGPPLKSSHLDFCTLPMTMDREEDLFSAQPASNLPVMVTGKSKGAPPTLTRVEMLIHVAQELEGRNKPIPPMFFERDVFERYLKNEVTSRAGKTALDVRDAAQCSQGAPANREDDAGIRNGESDGDDDSDSEEDEPAIATASNQGTVQPAPPLPAQLPRQIFMQEYDNLQDAEGEDYNSEDEEDIYEQTAHYALTLFALEEYQMAAIVALLLLARHR
ncbi:hypothetical protein C8R44DRAFT_730465 [Mycena epipterygia]|nr:hypothetical protein C8R44DRAFT_730465 [Mycena epipterygia]